MHPASAKLTHFFSCFFSELPWNSPVVEEPKYADWKENNTNHGLWLRLDTPQLALLRRMLSPAPSKRANLAQVKAHMWTKKKFRDNGKIKCIFYYICCHINFYLFKYYI